MSGASTTCLGSVALGIICAAILLFAGGCTHKPPGCEHDSVERCLWDHGLSPPEAQEGDASATPEGAPEPDEILGPDGARLSELDRKVLGIVEVMGVGLEWELVDERARELCGLGEPTPQGSEGEAHPPWTCLLELQLRGHYLQLEAGDGVLTLTITELDGTESQGMLEFAEDHYDGWCSGGRFVQVEGKRHEDFYRCGLEQGPYLVVSRFPSELERDRWQVSIAVLDAG